LKKIDKKSKMMAQGTKYQRLRRKRLNRMLARRVNTVAYSTREKRHLAGNMHLPRAVQASTLCT
jgi:hypothetical protein